MDDAEIDKGERKMSVEEMIEDLQASIRDMVPTLTSFAGPAPPALEQFIENMNPRSKEKNLKDMKKKKEEGSGMSSVKFSR